MKPASSGNYFSRRWNGQIPWSKLLWRDILGVGTVVNLAATFLAVAAAIQHAETAFVALLHFAPLPFNLFLFTALLRAPQRPGIAVTIAAAWLVAAMFL